VNFFLEGEKKYYSAIRYNTNITHEIRFELVVGTFCFFIFMMAFAIDGYVSQDNNRETNSCLADSCTRQLESDVLSI
jgi:hypothetical protein